MTDVPVTDVLPTVTVTATGGQTVFSFPFLVQASSQLEVIETQDPTGTPVVTTLTETTDYTVTINTPPAVGGTITLTAGSYPSGATAGDLYTLRRDIPIERLTDFPFRGGLSSATLNTQFDTIFLILQELERDIARAFTLPAADPLASITIPSVADRQGNLLGFDSTPNADAIAVAGTTPGTVIVSAFMETLLDDPDAPTGRTTLDAQEDVITTRGDIVVGNATSAASRLALGAAGTVLTSDGTDAGYAAAPLPPGYIDGLTLSADSGDTANDVNVAAGSARDGDDTESIVLASEITKQVDAAWSVGDDAGGLDTGVVADGNRYYIWLIKRTDTDIEDALFSLSSTAPTMPANYTKKRLIGFFDRVSGANEQLTKINTGSQVVQVVHFQTGDVDTGTNTIPRDNSKPQITEGDEYMQRAITPTNANNRLVIEVVFNFATSAAGDFACCLFQDATLDALAVSPQFADSTDSMYSVPIRHVMVAGTTSKTTFRVRAGNAAAGTTTFNGRVGGQLYGGAIVSSITITEIAG